MPELHRVLCWSKSHFDRIVADRENVEWFQVDDGSYVIRFLDMVVPGDGPFTLLVDVYADEDIETVTREFRQRRQRERQLVAIDWNDTEETTKE